MWSMGFVKGEGGLGLGLGLMDGRWEHSLDLNKRTRLMVGTGTERADLRYPSKQQLP